MFYVNCEECLYDVRDKNCTIVKKQNGKLFFFFLNSPINRISLNSSWVSFFFLRAHRKLFSLWSFGRRILGKWFDPLPGLNTVLI